MSRNYGQLCAPTSDTIADLSASGRIEKSVQDPTRFFQGARMSGPSKKADRRVQRSQQALQEALLQLMLEKGYAETSVSDIVERANVGRSTFYTHFADKEDLLQQSLQGLKAFLTDETLVPPEREGPSHPALSFALPMFLHAYEQKSLFERVAAARSGAPVQEQLQIMLIDLVAERLDSVSAKQAIADDGISSLERAQFIVGAFLAMLLHWVADPGSETPHAIDKKFRRLMLGGVFGGENLPLSPRPPPERTYSGDKLTEA